MSGNENDLEALVCEAILMTHKMRQAVIEIEHNEGIITLKGTVQSKKDKLTAEALARQQGGTVDVINKLRILKR